MITIRQMLEVVNRDEGWQAILDAQERLLRPRSFNCADALNAGLAIVRRAEAMGKRVAIHIELGGATVFQYHMDGTTRFHDWFIAQKENVARRTGLSTMRVFLNCVYRQMYKDEPWFQWDGNCVICGGCVPIRLESGAIVGVLTVSGGDHEEDHQLAAEGIAAAIGIEDIPSILG